MEDLDIFSFLCEKSTKSICSSPSSFVHRVIVFLALEGIFKKIVHPPNFTHNFFSAHPLEIDSKILVQKTCSDG